MTTSPAPPATATATSPTLHLGHSPDPDDAFMWWPLANFTLADGTALTPRIDTAGYTFVHVLEDIQSLNERAERAELELTAISIHQYPFVARDYALTSCGASMGEGYGPMIVTKSGTGPVFATGSSDAGNDPAAAPAASPAPNIQGLRGTRLAIPGRRTSAWLACQLLLHEHGLSGDDVDARVVAFDEIIPAVAQGDFDAGLLIHEGQLTYQDAGLTEVVNLGKWWQDTRGLPLPLGGNAIRRDLGEAMPTVCRVLLDSIRHAMEHRDAAVDFALRWARGMGKDLADRFVGMYVNDRTLDYGPDGRAAVQRLLTEAAAAGLVPDVGEVDFVEPA